MYKYVISALHRSCVCVCVCMCVIMYIQLVLFNQLKYLDLSDNLDIKIKENDVDKIK